MRFTALFALALLFSGAGTARAGGVDLELGFSSGYRIADLQWSIADNATGCCPDIRSELTWDNLVVLRSQADLELTLADHWYMTGRVGYGVIVSGDNRDSDYNGNGRTQEFARSENETADDDMLDTRIGFGYAFRMGGDRVGFSLMPLIGYAYSEQNLRITDGYQVIPATGAFQGLDSTYQTQWYGPWAGLDMGFRFRQRVRLNIGYEYHLTDYEAEANWNLRSDLAHPTSFEHSAEGSGHVFDLGVRVKLLDKPTLGLGVRGNASLEFWDTDAGVDRTYYANGTSAQTRLNGVEYDAFTMGVGVDLTF